MKKIQVSTATNSQLNWLVAKCDGKVENGVFGAPKVVDGALHLHYCDVVLSAPYEPTTDPTQMWPIIEREDIAIGHGNSKAHPDNRYEAAIIRLQPWAILAQGPTKLIAAARCYVVSKLGEEVEVPEELT